MYWSAHYPFSSTTQTAQHSLVSMETTRSLSSHTPILNSTAALNCFHRTAVHILIVLQYHHEVTKIRKFTAKNSVPFSNVCLTDISTRDKVLWQLPPNILGEKNTCCYFSVRKEKLFSTVEYIQLDEFHCSRLPIQCCSCTFGKKATAQNTLW